MDGVAVRMYIAVLVARLDGEDVEPARHLR